MKAPTKYLKKREDAINFLLEKPTRAYTIDTFHKLRVEINKLNAFFELINFYSKDFKRKKTFKPFKLIFRQAGKVRELQVEEAILRKYFLNNFIDLNFWQQIVTKSYCFEFGQLHIEDNIKKMFTLNR